MKYSTSHSPFISNLLVIILSDIDECAEGIHDCHENSTCANYAGSFSCYCNSGFTGNGTYCKGLFS